MLLEPLSEQNVHGNVGGGTKVNGAVLSCARAIADVGRVERYLVDQVEARKVSQLGEACGLLAYGRRAGFHQVLVLVLFFLACFGVLALFGPILVLPRVRVLALVPGERVSRRKCGKTVGGIQG